MGESRDGSLNVSIGHGVLSCSTFDFRFKGETTNFIIVRPKYQARRNETLVQRDRVLEVSDLWRTQS